jgi:hypothetical protein
MLETMLPSHAGDNATGTTCTWRDVNAESCLQQRYHVMLATTMLSRISRGAM